MRAVILLSVLLIPFAAPAQPPPPAPPPATPPGTPPAMPETPKPPIEVLGRPISPWIAELDSPDPHLRRTAAQILPVFGDPAKKAIPKIVDVWVKDLKDPDPTVRQFAVRAVLTYGDESKRAYPLVVAALVDRDNGVKANAIQAVGMVALEDPKLMRDAVKNLTSLLQGQQGMLRINAALALGAIGPDAREAVGNLVNLTKDPYAWEVRKAAAFALGRVALDEKGVPDRRAISTLCAMLTDEAFPVRVEAVQGLLVLGPPVQPDELDATKRTLEGRLKREADKALVVWIRVAQMRTDPAIKDAKIEESLAAIAKGLNDPEQRVRIATAEALGWIGPQAKSKVPALIEGLKVTKAEEYPFLLMCLWAISQMGNEGGGAEPEIKKLLGHKEEAIRQAAKDALDGINEKKKEKPKNP